jgi:hypothetical protein
VSLIASSNYPAIPEGSFLRLPQQRQDIMNRYVIHRGSVPLTGCHLPYLPRQPVQFGADVILVARVTLL